MFPHANKCSNRILIECPCVATHTRKKRVVKLPNGTSQKETSSIRQLMLIRFFWMDSPGGGPSILPCDQFFGDSARRDIRSRHGYRTELWYLIYTYVYYTYVRIIYTIWTYLIMRIWKKKSISDSKMSEETNCGRRVDVRLIRHSTGVLALFRFISLLFWYLRMNRLMGKIPSQVYDNYFFFFLCCWFRMCACAIRVTC